jgi:hypothetical protein
MTSSRALFDAVSWHVRGVFATEGNRRFGYRMRDLWQPAEVEARRGLARDLSADVGPELRLQRDAGCLVFDAQAIPSTDDVCAIGRRILQGRDQDGELAAGKKFSRFRIANRDERIALLKIALDRRMLAMAAAYLGVFPVIVEADYYCSFPVDGPFTKSQLWHCDDDAGDVIKFFVYCEDVEEADGPLEFVEPGASRRVRDAIGYRYAGRRYRVQDDVMARHLAPGEQHTVLGRRGTSFIVDTGRCFHRGSRIREPDRRRIIGTFCYCPPSSTILPRRLAAADAPLVQFATELSSPLERAALGLPIASKWL